MHAYTPRWLTAARLSQHLAWVYNQVNWAWVFYGLIIMLLVVVIVAFIVHRD